MTYPWAAGEVLTAADLNAYAGLIHINTTNIGTAVSSVAVSNVFSSTFDNYKIIINVDAFSAAAYIRIQLGSTTTGYYFGTAIVQYSSGTVTGLRSNNDNSWNGLGPGTTAGGGGTYDLLYPNKTEPTLIHGSYADYSTAGSGGSGSGFLNNTTSYTGFTVLTSTGTMTGGKIRVYGYNNG